MMRKMMAAFGVVVIAGCATMSGGPQWTTKGMGAFKSADKVFYGVGRSNAAIKDQSLRIEAADNRARADLQRVLDTYSASLMKDYNGTDGQLIERAVKTFSAGHVSGAIIVDHYMDSSGMTYSLAKLDLESFKKAMDMAQDLNDQAKKFVRERSDALFEELNKEEAKKGGQ